MNHEEYTEPTYRLSPKQELFCNEYLKDRNGTRAAIRAAYSEKTANEQACRLLTNVHIKARINELIKKQVDEIQVDIRFVLRQILNSATIDINDAYDENGNLKPISEMPESLRRAIIQVETEELFEGTGRDKEHIGTAKKIKIQDRLKALELLGKHLKMFTDVHEIPGLEGLAEKIAAARKRAEQCRQESPKDKPQT
jgi:phage terminase small subunit